MNTETTPPDSDQGSYDGDKAGLVNGMQSRSQSVRGMGTTRSMQSTGKPRTYFTHGGKVTVAEGQESPAQAAAKAAAVDAVQPKSAAPSISDKSTAGKKKGRFSMGFGKKSVAAN